MRIRSTLAAVAIGFGALLVSAPIALADSQPSSPAVSSPTPTQRQAPSASPVRPVPGAVPAETRAPAQANYSESGKVVKPRGAAETGGGMDESTPAGGLLLGGAGLLAVAGIGTVGYRRLRRQG
ncbi:MAG: hypothetical protein ABW215_15500 [Kibdelosporangium sp.]